MWDTLGDVYLAVFFDALWLPVLVAKFLLPLSSVFPASRRPNRASAECGRLSTELVSTTSTLSVRLRSALQGSTVLLRATVCTGGSRGQNDSARPQETLKTTES